MCYGTEDRETDKLIPKSDETIPFQIFKGNQIKDLKVLKNTSNNSEVKKPEENN